MVTSVRRTVPFDRVFVSPRGARREGAGDQDHEPIRDPGLVILISHALVGAGRTAGHTNTRSKGTELTDVTNRQTEGRPRESPPCPVSP